MGVLLLCACQPGASNGSDGSGLPTGPITRAELARFPEAQLRYPGSRVVEMVGADQSPARPGEEPNPAYVGAILVAAATPAQLYGWYGTWLTRHGFAPTVDYRPATQVSGEAWQMHRRLQVQVGIFDPVRLGSDQHLRVDVPVGSLLYEQVLVGYEPGLPKGDAAP